MLLSYIRKILLISAYSLCVFFGFNILPVFAQTTPAIQQYFVSKGDTLWLLAQRYGTTTDKLISLNPVAGKSTLIPGQALYLPVMMENRGIVYQVQKGDTFFLISSRTNRGINEIKQASGLSSDALVPGQILHIPAARVGFTYYIVKTGDILWTIGQNNNISVSEIMTTNVLSSSTILAGQILELPQRTSSTSLTIYRVKEGDYLSVIASKFGTTVNAISQTNHLNSDILMPGQPLFIPKGKEAVYVEGPVGLKKTGMGEFLPWNWARWIYNNGATATIIDWQTGKKFQVRYLGGSNHADSEPLTAKDTKIMASLYPTGWSWASRPILIQIGSRVLAASMAGMPHSIDTIANNNFDGHFDLYFYNSTSHNTNEIEWDHQANILKTAGITAAEANAFATKLNAGFNNQ